LYQVVITRVELVHLLTEAMKFVYCVALIVVASISSSAGQDLRKVKDTISKFTAKMTEYYDVIKAENFDLFKDKYKQIQDAISGHAEVAVNQLGPSMVTFADRLPAAVGKISSKVTMAAENGRKAAEGERINAQLLTLQNCYTSNIKDLATPLGDLMKAIYKTKSG